VTSVANAAPASTQGSASLKRASITEGAAITKTDALEPWAEEEAWRGLDTEPLEGRREHEYRLKGLPQGNASERERKPDLLRERHQ
jgi:hypothetical protein